MKRIVLAYSGDLDTLVAIPRLAEQYGAEVVAVTMDLGQRKDLEGVRDRALAAGAVRAHVLDLREEFARDYVLPAVKADAMFEGRPMLKALSRPLIARKVVEIAGIEQATAIAHGSAGLGSHHALFEMAARAKNPVIGVTTPAADWRLTTFEKIEYLRARGIPAPPDDSIYTSKSPVEPLENAASVELTFDNGVPVAVNGVAMPLVELIGILDTIAGAHGVGRIETPESRRDGGASRELIEQPAAVLLFMAHHELQRIVSTEAARRFSGVVGREYADVIEKGLWLTPLREALDAYIAKIQERVSGVIRLRLLKGDCRVVGSRSPFALEDDGSSGADPAVQREFIPWPEVRLHAD